MHFKLLSAKMVAILSREDELITYYNMLIIIVPGLISDWSTLI